MINQNLDVLERINLVINTITPKQRKLAEYIFHHYKQAAFLNSTDLAKAAQVSGSTVVRFAETLDYSGFPEMQSAMHSLIQLEINTVEMFSTHNEQELATDYAKIFHQASEHLLKIAKEISNNAFNEAVGLMERQKNILVIANQASSCLAEYTSYALGKIRPNVHKITNCDHTLFNRLVNFNNGDLAIIYAFPRFPRQTYKMAKLLASRNVPIIFITSRGTNPICEFATVTLEVNIKFASYVDDLAPVLYLSKALISSFAQNNRKQTTTQLEKFEDFVNATNLFCK